MWREERPGRPSAQDYGDEELVEGEGGGGFGVEGEEAGAEVELADGDHGEEDSRGHGERGAE